MTRSTQLSIVTAIALALAGTSILLRGPAVIAQSTGAATPAAVDAAIKASWTATAPDWAKRLDQDELQKICGLHKNAPPDAIATAIQAAAKSSMQYPADGKLIGDWTKGEVLAQNGYGMRFTDTDPKRSNGGNCYACHQMTKAELSYGTLGPSLLGYGKDRKFGEPETKAAYEKIYNAHSAMPCSQMPRFGQAGVLTVEQITHLVALLMDPASPVNK
jgi:L-cysteine S-thiosulfotransferase